MKLLLYFPIVSLVKNANYEFTTFSIKLSCLNGFWLKFGFEVTIDYHETDPGLLFSTYHKVISKISSKTKPVRTTITPDAALVLPRAVNDLEKAFLIPSQSGATIIRVTKNPVHSTTHASIWPSHSSTTK